MLSSLWNDFLKFLDGDKKTFPILYSLIKQTRPVELTEKNLVLGCENQGFRFFLEKKSGEIERALFLHLKRKLSVGFVVLEKKTKKEPPPLFSFQPSVNDLYRRANVSERYGFENFAVSSSNQVAYAAAQAVSDNVGRAYNPLFIHGGVGVGKTHLIHAIGKKVLEKDQEKKVSFCPGDQFTNELIESIREKSTPAFRRKYRKLSLLMIDDVQFIAGKQTVQEEFFHTFNSVVSFGGQIILTSDRPPSEIKNLEDRLRSRFSGGLIVDVQPPDFELKTAILLIKAKEKNIEIEIEAAKVIAEQVEDTRALEGALISVYAKIVGRKTTVDLESVDEFFSAKKELKAQRILPGDTIRAVCSYYNIKQSHLRGNTRESNVSLPRQVAMFILRKEFNLKLDQIAYLLKRKDHTTVIHAVEKISRLMAQNPPFKEEIDRIINSLKI